MSTNRIDDPALQAIENQLAGLAPQISSAEQQDLLYQCAFAAGKQTMTRSLRRWQGAVAALAVLLVSVSVPLANNQWTVARHEPPPPKKQTPTNVQIAAAEPVTDPIRPVVPARQFDAWQLALNSSDAVASNLEQMERTDPEMRSFGVVALTRAALHQ
jgi:hypothetical protein